MIYFVDENLLFIFRTIYLDMFEKALSYLHQ